MKYDLEDRTAKFAEAVIGVVGKIVVSPVNKRIIEQLVGSSGSIGANYNEANEGESKKDFYHKIQIAKKEIKETQHWLRLLAAANPELREVVRGLWAEVHELLLIFSKILSSRKNEN